MFGDDEANRSVALIETFRDPLAKKLVFFGGRPHQRCLRVVLVQPALPEFFRHRFDSTEIYHVESPARGYIRNLRSRNRAESVFRAGQNSSDQEVRYLC